MSTRIILVDDHAVVRAGFKMLLAADGYIEVIGEAARGEQAIQIYQEMQPDIVVMDLSMPGSAAWKPFAASCSAIARP